MINYPNDLDEQPIETAGTAKQESEPVAGNRRYLSISGGSLLLLGLALLGEEIVEVVSSALEMAYELFAQNAEDFFRKVVGLDWKHAQMATAYLDGFIALTLLFVVSRKLLRLGSIIYRLGTAWFENVRGTWLTVKAWSICWWQAQDWLNKAAAIIAMLVIVVPAMILLSIGLGSAVAAVFT